MTGDKYQEKIAHSFRIKLRSPYLVLCVDDRREESEDQDNLGQQGCEPSYEGSFFGYSVEDYITDKVVNVDIFERAQETYENIDPDLIDKIYSSSGRRGRRFVGYQV